VRWLFVIAFVWAVGSVSLWWMFRPHKVRERDPEAKRERLRQIERDRLEEWRRRHEAKLAAKRLKKPKDQPLYDDGDFPPSAYPVREFITLSLFMLGVFALFWWLLWRWL
jgi:hypothetical protein